MSETNEAFVKLIEMQHDGKDLTPVSYTHLDVYKRQTIHDFFVLKFIFKII